MSLQRLANRRRPWISARTLMLLRKTLMAEGFRLIAIRTQPQSAFRSATGAPDGEVDMRPIGAQPRWDPSKVVREAARPDSSEGLYAAR